MPAATDERLAFIEARLATLEAARDPVVQLLLVDQQLTAARAQLAETIRWVDYMRVMSTKLRGYLNDLEPEFTADEHLPGVESMVKTLASAAAPSTAAATPAPSGEAAGMMSMIEKLAGALGETRK